MFHGLKTRFDYLEACDAVISRGGHETLMQSISYGKPSVIIPVPKHPEQYGNARRAMELEGSQSHASDEMLTLDHLVQRIDDYLSQTRLRIFLMRSMKKSISETV